MPKVVSSRWRTVALVAIGVAIGSTMGAAPVYSHVGGTVAHLWTKHLRARADARYFTKRVSDARYFTKRVSDARYFTKRVSDARFYKRTDIVANANALDGQDSTAFSPAAHNHDGRYYASGSKVADAETLDALDSAAFLQNGAAAGGDLAGTYPSPSLAPNSVQAPDIADGAVGSTEIADNTLQAEDTFRLEGVVSVDVPSVPANSCIQHAVFVGLREGGDLPIFFPTGNFASLDLSLYAERDINDGGSFFVTVCNVAGAPIDPPAGLWGFVVIRP